MSLSVDAQVTDLTGEYQMKRGGEMVSVLVLKKDSSFEYYFMYGAVNRIAKGSYEHKDKKVVLHGTKTPSMDFTVTGSKTDSSGTDIHVSDPTPALTQSVMCMFEKGDQRDIQYTDDEGMAHSHLENCNNIFVMHMLYKDIMTTVVHGREPDDHNNHYELTLNRSLEEVCFKDFELTVKGNTLTGSMPYLWEEEKSEFVKL